MGTRLVVGLDTLVGLSTAVPAVFVEAVIESSLYFSYILLVTAFAPNHVDKVFRVTGNVVSNRFFCFACGMQCVRSKFSFESVLRS